MLCLEYYSSNNKVCRTPGKSQEVEENERTKETPTYTFLCEAKGQAILSAVLI